MFVERGTLIVEALASARSRRGFLKAVDDYERLLATVLDCPSTFFTAGGYDGLSRLTDRAIDEIEARLDSRTDRTAVQRHLAASVYHLREELESIYKRLHDGAAGVPARTGQAATNVSPST